MHLPIPISSLLHGKAVEWERLEFKEGWNPLDVLHTMCAFANDIHNLGGGYIIIGVGEKDGRPVLPPKGITAGLVDKIQKELLNLTHSSLQPHYYPLISPETVDGKLVLVLWVPGGQSRPYKAKLSLGKEEKGWAWFIRKGSSTVRAKGDDEKDLLSLTATIPFDDRINQQATLADLDLGLIRTFLRAIGSDLYAPSAELDFAMLCRQMQIVDGPPEALFPRNVGLLFFNEEPHRFFPQDQIDVLYFPEGAGGDKFEEKIFRGPLDRMLRDALDFIRGRFLVERVIKHSGRAKAERFFNFPFDAIEEALANAVYHRGYDVREPVEVRISPNDVVILNYPGPVHSVRLDDLRHGHAVSRRYRNRRIGEFLKELQITEGRATGIPKIIRAMKQNGSPPPEFESDEERSYFLARFPVHPHDEAARELATAPKPESRPESWRSRPEWRPEWGPESLHNRIMQILQTRLHSRAGISKALGHTSVSGAAKNALTDLLEQGLVEYTIPEKPQSRNQQYRVTPGRQER